MSLSWILVSSLSFSIADDLFTTYYSVFGSAQGDERCTCPCSRYISHYLVLGLSCILVGSPLIFIVEGSFTMYYSVI